MLKILNVITTGFAFNGGLSTVALNYYKYLPQDSFSVDFASYNEIDSALEKYLKQNKSQYCKLPHRKKNIISYMYNLLRLIKKNKYDIIHIHGNSATMFFELLPAILGGINCRIVHVHTTQSEYPKLHKLLYPFFIRSFTVAIAVSKKSGDWLYKDKKYYVLNNAIELSKYRFNKESRYLVRQRYNIKNELVIGNVGKFTDSKNQLFLIDIFYYFHLKCPNSKLMLVGDGDYRNVLEQKIKKCHLEDDVIFVGLVDDASEYYSAIDCFIFPSKYEGLGLALLEAQASGLYCIASSSVPKETKLTNCIDYEDLDAPTEEWVNKITYIQDRELQCIENLKEIENKGYNIEKEVNKLIDIYISNI